MKVYTVLERWIDEYGGEEEQIYLTSFKTKETAYIYVEKKLKKYFFSKEFKDWVEKENKDPSYWACRTSPEKEFCEAWNRLHESNNARYGLDNIRWEVYETEIQ